jgi:hypothetical protein
MNIFKKLVFMVDTLVYLVFCCVGSVTNMFPMLVSHFVEIVGEGEGFVISVAYFLHKP